MTFSELGINEYIIQALQNNKISIPTDIQKQAIPHILNKKQDLVAVAQTGTGKTAAFCLPILQSIDPMLPKIQALVLVPTRELGQQVAREFFLFSKYLPRVFAESVYGGAPIDEQIQNLKRATHVVVATPGRLIDLLDRKAIDLSSIKTLVLDEADEMLSMGFRKDLDSILKHTAGKRHTWLFSATMPAGIKAIISSYMSSKAIRFEVNRNEIVNKDIEHKFLICSRLEKPEALFQFF